MWNPAIGLEPATAPQPEFRIPGEAVGPLVLTLLAFALAAVCGIFASALRWHNVAAPDQLNVMLGEKWPIDEIDARNYVADLDVRAIESLRAGNNGKAGWLTTALVAQVAGLAPLTVAVYMILNAAS